MALSDEEKKKRKEEKEKEEKRENIGNVSNHLLQTGIDFLTNAPRTMTSIGYNGGFIQNMQGNLWYIQRQYKKQNVYENMLGLPCCKTVKIGNLTGYAIFDCATLKCSNGMLEDELKEINNLLGSGVYINE